MVTFGAPPNFSKCSPLHPSPLSRCLTSTPPLLSHTFTPPLLSHTPFLSTCPYLIFSRSQSPFSHIPPPHLCLIPSPLSPTFSLCHIAPPLLPFSPSHPPLSPPPPLCLTFPSPSHIPLSHFSPSLAFTTFSHPPSSHITPSPLTLPPLPFSPSHYPVLSLTTSPHEFSPSPLPPSPSHFPTPSRIPLPLCLVFPSPSCIPLFSHFPISHIHHHLLIPPPSLSIPPTPPLTLPSIAFSPSHYNTNHK